MPDIYVQGDDISIGILIVLVVVALVAWSRSRHGGWDD